jgi:hypothetical protein
MRRLAGVVSTIGAVASNGPRDDFHNQPTQHGEFGTPEQPPTGQIPSSGPPPNPPEGFEQPGDVDQFDQETEPTPWYRRPAMLIAWLISVVILIALIVFGVIELIHGQQTRQSQPENDDEHDDPYHHDDPDDHRDHHVVAQQRRATGAAAAATAAAHRRTDAAAVASPPFAAAAAGDHRSRGAESGHGSPWVAVARRWQTRSQFHRTARAKPYTRCNPRSPR